LKRQVAQSMRATRMSAQTTALPNVLRVHQNSSEFIGAMVSAPPLCFSPALDCGGARGRVKSSTAQMPIWILSGRGMLTAAASDRGAAIAGHGLYRGTSEYPPYNIPTIFADGIATMAYGHSMVRLYLARHDPSLRPHDVSAKTQPFAQVVMPLNGFAETAVFFGSVLSRLVRDRLLSEDLLTDLRARRQAGGASS
jgi:hypothetical protein